MRISEMVQNQQQNRLNERNHKCPELKNGSLPPPGHVNPYGDPSMNITGMTSADWKIIPVDEDVANAMRDIVFRSMKETGGMGVKDDSDIFGRTVKAYLMTIPPEDRINAGWTLNEIFHQEAVRLGEYVHQRDPSWNWGRPVAPGILESYQKGIDIVV